MALGTTRVIACLDLEDHMRSDLLKFSPCHLRIVRLSLLLAFGSTSGGGACAPCAKPLICNRHRLRILIVLHTTSVILIQVSHL